MSKGHITKVQVDNNIDDSEETQQEIQEIYLTDLVKRIKGYDGNVYIRKVDLLYVNVDQIGFRKLTEYCITQFFSPSNANQLAIDLLQ